MNSPIFIGEWVIKFTDEALVDVDVARATLARKEIPSGA